MMIDSTKTCWEGALQVHFEVIEIFYTLIMMVVTQVYICQTGAFYYMSIISQKIYVNLKTKRNESHMNTLKIGHRKKPTIIIKKQYNLNHLPICVNA